MEFSHDGTASLQLRSERHLGTFPKTQKTDQNMCYQLRTCFHFIALGVLVLALLLLCVANALLCVPYRNMAKAA